MRASKFTSSHPQSSALFFEGRAAGARVLLTRTTTPATIEPGWSRITPRRSSSGWTSVGCWRGDRHWIVAGDRAERSRHLHGRGRAISGASAYGQERRDAQTRSTPPTASPEDGRSPARDEPRFRRALLRGCLGLRVGG